MNIDEFLELVRKRRSIRAFKSDPIPDGYVEKIIEAARWAMSGANAQPWEFIVVRNQEIKNKISELYAGINKTVWDIEKTRIKELRHPQYAEAPSYVPDFQDAPVLIIVCGDPRTYQASILGASFLAAEGGPNAVYLKNMANATQNLHLAAAALGLGSQWVSIADLWEGPLKALLGVPEELRIHTIVLVGYPTYEPQPGYRRELKEIVHYEKYDHSKYRSGDDIFNFLVALRKRVRPAYQAKSGS